MTTEMSCDGSCYDCYCREPLGTDDRNAAIGGGIIGTALLVTAVVTFFLCSEITIPLCIGAGALAFFGSSIITIASHKFHWQNIINEWITTPWAERDLDRKNSR